MKKMIFAMISIAAIAGLLAACSGSSNGNNNNGCINGYCSNTCGSNLGYSSPYGPYQMIGAQCYDTTRNVVVQPQLCPGNQYGNQYGNSYGSYNGYSPYCNQTAGLNPYFNPMGNYPMTGVCGYGAMQVYSPTTGATICAPQSYQNQFMPYATPTYYQGSMWFYLYL